MNEIESLRALDSALAHHDEETRHRLMTWAWDRYIEQPKRDRRKAKEDEAAEWDALAAAMKDSGPPPEQEAAVEGWRAQAGSDQSPPVEAAAPDAKTVAERAER